MRTLGIGLLLLLAVFGSALPAQCATLYVKSDSPYDGPGNDWDHAYHTVTAGLNAAATGDEVWVAAGLYVEKITLKSGVELYGGFPTGGGVWETRSPETNTATLDGNRGGSVVTVPAGVTDAVIDGFTIQNGTGTFLRGGYYSWSGYYGGGIHAVSSSFVISNCIIADNEAAYGGGIYCQGGRPSIVRNLITRNTVDAGYLRSAWGGGILCEENSLATIANNTISYNSAPNMCSGGIQIIQSPAIITCNRIEHNTSLWASAGIDINSCSPIISGNFICANAVTNPVIPGIGTALSGGAALWAGNGAPIVTNNTIVDNGTDLGGAIYLTRTNGRFSNNVVAFNSCGIYGGEQVQNTVFANNCMYENGDYDYSGVPPGAGDIHSDPRLADWAAGDYHLSPASPCVDAGLSDAPGLTSMDIDGQGRIWGRAVDIGADEIWPVSVKIDIKPGGSPNPINLASRGLTTVAILSDSDLDARWIDPASIVFAGCAVAVQGDRPMAGAEDVDRDGDQDMVMHFETRLLQLDAGSSSASLVGRMPDGQPVVGSDSVVIIRSR